VPHYLPEPEVLRRVEWEVQMRCVKYLVPLTVALLCAFAFAADDHKDSHGKGDGSVFGVLSAAPAGGDAKLLGVLKTKEKHEDKSLNVMAANDEVAAKIKELVAKGAKVKAKGEKSADGNSITISEIKEATIEKHGDKEHK